MNHNIVKKTDSIYFEDVIAKAILFRAAEKLYGVSPNSIGDMRYVTVPYSISYFSFITKGKLDLYKVWKAQSLSSELKSLLHLLMIQIETFIKKTAPGSLYGEWAKKEECWEQLKKQKLEVNLDSIKSDMQDSKSGLQRTKIAEEETELLQIEEDVRKLKSISPKTWMNIEEWGRVTKLLTANQQTWAWNIFLRLKNNNKLTEHERVTGLKLLDIVIEKYPEILNEL